MYTVLLLCTGLLLLLKRSRIGIDIARVGVVRRGASSWERGVFYTVVSGDEVA